MGRGEHDHRNHPELLIRFDLLQHLQSIDFGQFQIEEQDGGITIRAGSEGTPAIKIIQGLLDLDRKSTRLNSSHTVISYAVFCLKKKKKENKNIILTSPSIV